VKNKIRNKDFNKPKPVKLDINIDDLETIKCIDKECNGEDYDLIYRLKKVSPLTSHSGKEEIIAVAYFRCTKCGKVTTVLKR
jgi:hypothetical protein